jgi:hypothetical protein
MYNQELTNLRALIVDNVVSTDAGSINFGIIEYIGKIPGLIHHLVDCSLQDDTFTLDNQSKWKTSHIEMIQNWKLDDDLYLTQNQAFLSTDRFAIVNPRLLKAVPISLIREPLPIDQKMFFITEIDSSNDVITLSNGMEYTVYSHDHGTLRRFSENDRVILGFNSSEKMDPIAVDDYKFYLLIDTTLNSYVRANPIR